MQSHKHQEEKCLTCLHRQEKEKTPSDIILEEHLNICADTFKVLGDRTRMKILFSLFEGGKNVCAIAEIVQSTHSNTSHQLKVLKDNRLVKYTKTGKEVTYEILDNHVKQIVENMLDHAMHKCKEDI